MFLLRKPDRKIRKAERIDGLFETCSWAIQVPIRRFQYVAAVKPNGHRLIDLRQESLREIEVRGTSGPLKYT